MIDFIKALCKTAIDYFSASVDIGDNALITGKIIIWSIVIGIGAAAIISFINRATVGKFVLALLNKGAESPETALSAEDLSGLSKFAKHKLNKNGVLSKIIKSTDDSRYYILPKDASRAENLFAKNGADLKSLIFTLAALLLLAALAYFALPRLADMAKGVANSFASLGK